MPRSAAPLLPQSRAWLERAQRVIPGASQTASKGPSQWVQGLAPAFVRRAEGARVQDVDGRWFLDLPAALGPVLLGHGHAGVAAAVQQQLADGITFTLPHVLEVEVAERLTSMVPSAERVRFAKSGSDATSAAVRVARAATGRDRVVSTGYHGWHDWHIGTSSRSAGVPAAVSALTTAVPGWRGDALAEVLAEEGDRTACVVVEPVGGAEPTHEELAHLLDLVHEHGALLVFDEVVSGFRVANGGAQERYGVVPDLTALGKGLGNGMPVSALVGRADVMSVLDDAFFSGTHGGEALSLAAARATLDALVSEPVTEHLWRLGTALADGVREQVALHDLGEWVSVGGAAPWTLVLVREPDPAAGGLAARSLLQQEMLRRGVLYNGSNFVSWAWGEAEVAEAVEAYGGAFAVLRRALPDDADRYLEGEPVGPVFRTTR